MNTMTRNSKFWLLVSAVIGLGSLVGCISDDSDPAEDDDGGTGGTTGGSGGSSSGTSGTGGTSGTSSTGGSGGGSTTVCAAPITVPAASPGIADFEYDGPALADDALGMWSFALGGDTSTGVFAGPFGYGDDGVNAMTGQPTPETFALVDGNDSVYGLSISDTMADEYGGGMGLWISECLDATGFSGISFWVRGNAPTGMAKLTLLMRETTAEVGSSSTDKIGTCPGTDDQAEMSTCTHPTFTFPVTDTWTEVRAAWSAFAPGSSVGTPVVPDGRNIWQIQYDIGLEWLPDDAGVYQPTPSAYELTVDDLTFY